MDPKGFNLTKTKSAIYVADPESPPEFGGHRWLESVNQWLWALGSYLYSQDGHPGDVHFARCSLISFIL